MVWLSALLVVTQATCWVVAVMGPNTCSRQETYTVTMRVLEKRPITTKTYTWCFKMPPRCTKYKQEVVDHFRIQSEPRTRWVNECCPGYRPDAADMYCDPVCPLGCDHGTCSSPHVCSCHPGYFGLSCDKTECPEDRWGPGCQLNCSCLNSASCHPETGHCSCTPGYWGNWCESTCPSGTYGDRCEKRCSCADPANTCHHITGACNTCNGSSSCQTEWIPTQPDVIQQLINNAAIKDDTPVPEPLVTTSDDIRSSDTAINEHVIKDDAKMPDASTLENYATTSESEFSNTAFDVVDSERTTSIASIPYLQRTTAIRLTTAASPFTPTTTTTTSVSSEDPLLAKENLGRFVEDESHEDQLDHGRPEYGTERASGEVQTTEESDETSETFTEPSVNERNIRTKTLQEETTEEDNIDVGGQDSEISEVSTQGPYQTVEKVTELTESDGVNLTKTDDQRKKFIDQKKYKFKERLKDSSNQKPDMISQKSVDVDHVWVVPEQEHEESPKHFEQVQDGSHRDHMEKIVDIGKPKKASDQKRTKEVADMGQLKITANQERQQGDNRSSYDFLSSFSIAAGVSTGIIMVAGLITLMARCRKTKPKKEATAAVELETVNNKQDDARVSIAAEETTVPMVRPLFFSPVYLPGDVSPTEGNGGLILTAVFSRPATNIHDLYRQQDLLRETLAPHYDVPPPTGTRNSICTSIGTVETEHVYEELPCWRNQPQSLQSESSC